MNALKPSDDSINTLIHHESLLSDVHPHMNHSELSQNTTNETGIVVQISWGVQPVTNGHPNGTIRAALRLGDCTCSHAAVTAKGAPRFVGLVTSEWCAK